MEGLNLLFIIANQSDEDKVLKNIKKYNIGFKYIMYGEGTASSSLLEYFGLNDEKKFILMLILPVVLCKNIMIKLKKTVNMDDYGKGIAFSIPLTSSTKYIVNYYKDYELEDVDMLESRQELIVTIVNHGYSEQVMNVAKKCGANGGTLISGRGLGDGQGIKFLNISIEPEKDIILNLVSSDIKRDIMNSIVDNCGLKSPGTGICFSLPVDYVVGLNK